MVHQNLREVTKLRHEKDFDKKQQIGLPIYGVALGDVIFVNHIRQSRLSERSLKIAGKGLP